jgi:hypothetical protein
MRATSNNPSSGDQEGGDEKGEERQTTTAGKKFKQCFTSVFDLATQTKRYRKVKTHRRKEYWVKMNLHWKLRQSSGKCSTGGYIYGINQKAKRCERESEYESRESRRTR